MSRFKLLVGFLLLLFIGLITKNLTNGKEVKDTNFTQEQFTKEQPSKTPYTNPLLEFSYPDAKSISFDSSRLIFESSDDPQTITDWYKNKIESKGFSRKSFSQTKVNNNVYNILSASDGKREITIEIKKESSDPKTKITIN